MNPSDQQVAKETSGRRGNWSAARKNMVILDGNADANADTDGTPGLSPEMNGDSESWVLFSKVSSDCTAYS